MSDWKNTPVEWHEGPDSIIQLTSLGKFASNKISSRPIMVF